MTEKSLENARQLRSSMTDAEKLFWSRVRNRQFENLKFKRQQPVPPYIVDFFCEERRLVIEIDGGQHSKDADAKRDVFLSARGLTVLHYWNNDVLKNIESVLSDIKNHLSPEKGPSPKPSPDGRGLSGRIQIGKITGAHGIRGEVKVTSLAADSGLLFRKEGVFTAVDGGVHLKLAMRSEMKPGVFITRIDGITDRNEAEKYNNTALYIDRDDLPETDDDTFYLSDLVGLDVVTPEGKALGRAAAIHNFGASDLLDITGADGKSFYIPLTDDFLIEVDFDQNKVVMAEPEVME